MRKGLAALVAVTAMALAWRLLLRPSPENAGPGTTPSPTAAQNAAIEKALATASAAAASAITSNFVAAPAPQTVFYSAPAEPAVAPAGNPHSLEYTNLAPAIVLDRLRHAIRDYGSMFGGNPVGSNSEITSQLNGKNPKQADFIQSEAGMRLNANGELVDPWGTPYFFHQLSGTRMEIRSAGPDRILWTADDLVTE